jgi:hypothetical protein
MTALINQRRDWGRRARTTANKGIEEKPTAFYATLYIMAFASRLNMMRSTRLTDCGEEVLE